MCNGGRVLLVAFSLSIKDIPLVLGHDPQTSGVADPVLLDSTPRRHWIPLAGHLTKAPAAVETWVLNVRQPECTVILPLGFRP